MTEQSRGRSRSGRRPGDSGTREAIRAAARAQFAEQGFDRTSMRSVALQAGVDPTLVSHFFGSKQKLFAEVMQLPFDPSAVIPRIVAGDPAGIGTRLAAFVVSVLETPEGRGPADRAGPGGGERGRGRGGGAGAGDAGTILGPLAAALGSDQPELRGSLVGSQVVGMVMARYVVRIEPLA